MRHLFSDWKQVSSKIKKSRRAFLFLDYDGTLTPIVSRPEDAALPISTKNSIKKLRFNPRFKIAIISGRSLKDAKNMVRIKDIIYAGNHGLEIEYEKGKVLRPKIARGSGVFLKKIKIALNRELHNIKGARVEDKGFTLSMHFRMVSLNQRSRVKKVFARIVRPYLMSNKVKVSSGKMVLEVRPRVDWHKAKALLWLLRKNRGCFPIYIGDDVTDMDAFRAIKDIGMSIFVGKPTGKIRADYFLKNPRETGSFISRLTNF